MEDVKGTRVLVLSNVGSDAALVRRLLTQDELQVEAASDPTLYAQEFDHHRPQVLVLAFKELTAAEGCYLGLFRHSQYVHGQPHRTVVLCNKDDLARAYALCAKDYFDDYVLFWPLNHDAPRLQMAVRSALRQLSNHRALATLSQLAYQARRISELEGLLGVQINLGQTHTQHAQQALDAAHAAVGAALRKLSDGLLDDGLQGAVHIHEPLVVASRLKSLDEGEISPHLQQAAQALQPVGHWIGGLRDQLAAPLQAARLLGHQTDQHRPLLLVVEDDEFQRKLLSKVLLSAPCELECVGNATDALVWMNKHTPDLILMDVHLPDSDGIQLTRRIKRISAFAHIPIIMLTGQSERQVIVDSRAAGAIDFIVKPFDRDSLLRKVSRYLGAGNLSAPKVSP